MVSSAEILAAFREVSNTKQLDRAELYALLQDGILAALFGGLISLIALGAMNEPTTKETSQFYAENAYLLAKGKNIVNVMLVDFRGFDTMIEITVLSIAAIGVYSLMKLRISSDNKE